MTDPRRPAGDDRFDSLFDTVKSKLDDFEASDLLTGAAKNAVVIASSRLVFRALLAGAAIGGVLSAVITVLACLAILR